MKHGNLPMFHMSLLILKFSGFTRSTTQECIKVALKISDYPTHICSVPECVNSKGALKEIVVFSSVIGRYWKKVSLLNIVNVSQECMKIYTTLGGSIHTAEAHSTLKPVGIAYNGLLVGSLSR